MNSIIAITLAGIALFTSIAGCVVKENIPPQGTNPPDITAPKANENSLFLPYADNAPKGAVAAILNLPDDATLKSLGTLEVVTLMETDEHMVIVPRFTDTKITIYPIEYQPDTDKLVDLPHVFEKAESFTAVHIKVSRPETIPGYRIELKESSGNTCSYIISYNGKDGNADIEYIATDR